MDPLPFNPEQWLAVVGDAVRESGHGSEVVVALETTVSGWRVSVMPPIVTAPVDPPVTEG